MAKHSAPRTRSPFWAIVAGTAAAAAIATGTLGWATSSAPVEDTPHAAASVQRYSHPCNWVGHDCYSAVTGVNLTRVKAAELIAERMRSGQPMFEDWTWVGMPTIVGEWNDVLYGEWRDYDPTAASARDWLAAGGPSHGDGDEQA